MKKLHIFKAGRHTAMSGVTLQFSEDELQRAAEVYDPAVHEAPIVVGHPKDNGPAYGWITGLNYAEGDLEATPDQVDEAFSEMVEKGRFKKVSASFYTPDSPSNPVPGSYYLRHVGFLGAQPPAIKGLRGVEFAETEEGVVEFHDYFGANNIARLFRRLREWMIAESGMETADRVLPDYSVRDLEDGAQKQYEALASEAEPEPGFAEPNPDEVDDMTKEELQKQQQQIDADKAALEKERAEFAEAKAKLEMDGHLAYAEGLAKAGKIAPGMKQAVAGILGALNKESVVSFAEGGETAEVGAADALKRILDNAKPVVEFGEAAGGDTRGEDDDGVAYTEHELTEQAVAYQEEMRKKGITVNISDAVAHVIATNGKAA